MKSDMSDSNINIVNISVPPSRVLSSFDIRCIFYKIEPQYLVSTDQMTRRYLKELENIRHSLTIFFSKLIKSYFKNTILIYPPKNKFQKLFNYVLNPSNNKKCDFKRF